MNRLTSLLLFFVFVTSSSLKAQRDDQPFQFGFKIAPNLGWIKPVAETYSPDGMTTGFSWGFVGDYNFNQTYGISSGFSITSNNGKLKYPHKEDTLSGTMHRKYKIRSLEFPILLKMRTKDIGSFTYFGLIGFGTSINMSAKAEDNFNVSTPSQYSVLREPDIKSRISFLRESLIVGLGAQYTISGSTQAFGGITFNNGFTDILKGKNTVKSSIEEEAISNYLELSIGVMF